MTEEPKKVRPKPHRLWRWLRTFAFLYLAICLLMMFFENRLVYPVPTASSPAAWEISQAAQTDVSFEAEDGTALHGWFFAHEQPRHAILYCHGNGEDVSSNAAYMAYLRDKLEASIFLFDYRTIVVTEKARVRRMRPVSSSMDWLPNAGLPKNCRSKLTRSY